MDLPILSNKYVDHGFLKESDIIIIEGTAIIQGGDTSDNTLIVKFDNKAIHGIVIGEKVRVKIARSDLS